MNGNDIPCRRVEPDSDEWLRVEYQVNFSIIFIILGAIFSYSYFFHLEQLLQL